MSNYPEDYHSHNDYCQRHNLTFHPIDGCPACEEEPAMLKHTIPEAKEALQQLEQVRLSYEHRIGVVQDYISDLQRELETLFSEHQDVEEMERSIDYDIDCIINDETPSGFHINEMYDDVFSMPEPVQCNCTTCRLDAITARTATSDWRKPWTLVVDREE